MVSSVGASRLLFTAVEQAFREGEQALPRPVRYYSVGTCYVEQELRMSGQEVSRAAYQIGAVGNEESG